MIERLIDRLAALTKESGLEVRNPPSLTGRSGIEHVFSLLMASKNGRCAVDVYDSVRETEVLRTFLKKFDTGASCHIMSLSGGPSESAMKFASSYRIKCFTVEEAEALLNAKREVLTLSVRP